MTPNPQTPSPAPAEELPRHAASDAPVTRGYRLGFQVWMLCLLLTLVITLVLYLFDKIYFAVAHR